MTGFEHRIGKRPMAWIDVGLIAWGVLMAWVYRFVQDDAFISFRYARNLANGLGLVWNSGEQVEGYTNFLWTVLMAGGIRMGMDVVVWCYTCSILSFIATLLLTLVSAPRRTVATAALALLVANYSFVSYATGGLETQFTLMLSLAAATVLTRVEGPYGLLWGGLFAAFSFLSRMDSALIVAPFILARLLKDDLRHAYRLLPAVIVAGAWMFVRHAYYGSWVPNTFLIKGDVNFVRGILYGGLFVVCYGGWLLLPRMTAWRPWHALSPTKVSVVLWLAYMVIVGGDFMEFRFWIPCLPFVALWIAEDFDSKGWSRKDRLMFTILVLLGLIGIPRWLPVRLVQSVPDLEARAEEWGRHGQALREILATNDVKIAVSPAGVIPYVSQLPSFDNLGLNHRDVALNGKKIPPAHKWLGNWPGHVRMATWEQTVRAGVNLQLGTPWVVRKGSIPELQGKRVLRSWVNRHFSGGFLHPEIPMGTLSRLIAWPLTKTTELLTLEVVPSGHVETAIAKTGARVLVVEEGNISTSDEKDDIPRSQGTL